MTLLCLMVFSCLSVTRVGFYFLTKRYKQIYSCSHRCICVCGQELPAAEEVSVTLPEQAELLPVGTVSSILQQLGKHHNASNPFTRKCHFVSIRELFMSSVINLRVPLLSYCPVSQGHPSSEWRQRPLHSWQGVCRKGEHHQTLHTSSRFLRVNDVCFLCFRCSRCSAPCPVRCTFCVLTLKTRLKARAWQKDCCFIAHLPSENTQNIFWHSNWHCKNTHTHTLCVPQTTLVMTVG